MNPNVVKRFVKYMVILTLLAGLAGVGLQWFESQEPGDYYVRQGDIRLSDGEFEAALESFDKALAEMPNHRGALMGRALVYIQSERYPEALAELDYLIDYLEKTLESDDRTGWAALASAYANRGTVYDRLGKYETALRDYVAALKTDEETVSGPGLIHKILFGSERVSTVRDRAEYLAKQLQLPEDQRLMRVPELDAKQRMHKP